MSEWIPQCLQILERLEVEPWDDNSVTQKKLLYGKAAQVLDICVSKLRQNSEEIGNYERYLIGTLADQIAHRGSADFLRWDAAEVRTELPWQLTGWPMPHIPQVEIRN